MTLRFSSSYALAYDLLNESKPYTLQELSLAAKFAGLDLVGCGPWMTTGRKLSSSDWYGWIALQKSSRS